MGGLSKGEGNGAARAGRPGKGPSLKERGVQGVGGGSWGVQGVPVPRKEESRGLWCWRKRVWGLGDEEWGSRVS